MKKFLKKYSILLVGILAIVFLIVFFCFLFNRPGKVVYVTDIVGDVRIGTSDDLSLSTPATDYMRLVEGSVIVTGKTSSCTLSYVDEADGQDNSIYVCENTQLSVYKKHVQGGYNFFLIDGSVFCCAPKNSIFKTNVTTPTYNLYVDSTIAQMSYSNDDKMGKVFVFDGNPDLQLVQPSGSMGQTERLLKNSVCAVKDMDDGTIGFGYLNTGFGLSMLNSQSLKMLSGVAANWPECIAYTLSEIETAFKASNEYALYAPKQEQIVTTTTPIDDIFVTTEDSSITIAISDVTTVPSETASDDFSPTSSETVEETTVDSDQDNIHLRGSETTTTVPDETVDSSELTITSTSSTTTAVEPSITSTNITTTVPATNLPTTTTTVDPETVYTVIFTYQENGEKFWAMQLVKRGQSAIAPDVPGISGKRFVGWDADFTNVTSDLTINGIFESTDATYNVDLYVADKLWKTVTVKSGEDVILSEEPISEDETLVFAGWSDSLTNIRSDKTIFALFVS